MHPASSHPLDVIYDPSCGLCSGCVRWLEQLDRRERLRFVRNDRPEALAAGATAEQVAHTVVVVDRVTRQRWTSARAVARVLAAFPGLDALGGLMALPPLAWLAECGYQLIEANRHRLSRWLALRPMEPAGTT